jgi:RNA polymerase sigma-70 factor (ECF subfamily)
VLALYDQLLAIAPTPVVALNRAVALAEVDGPDAALRVVEDLRLPGYAPLPAVRADLLRRTGQHARARQAYDEAIAACGNQAQRAFLTLRRAQLDD